jgi:hypothetical protein
MSDSTLPREGWPHPDLANNQANFPTEELWKHIGKHIAWNWDGTQIVASDADEGELVRKLLAAGYDLSRVVLGYVDDPDVSYL